MLSTIATISLFAEIFAGGVLVSGFFAFAKKFFTQKQAKDLVLSFIFLAYASFVCLMLASQLFYNLGKSISFLIFFQKAIAYNLIIGSLFVFLFIRYKFKLKGLTAFVWIYALAAFYMCYRVAVSTVDLVYRADVIEPLVNFSQPTPVRSAWIFAWLALFIISGALFIKQKGNIKALLFYDSASALIIFLSFGCTIAYTGTANPYFLPVSWLLTLIGTIGLILGEIIPQESTLAKNPFNFFRSRILFKLIFIFVLLIVILFEVTTLATLTLSKQALKVSIFATYKEAAEGIAQKVNSLDTIDQKALEKVVRERRIGNAGVVFIIDEQGNLIAHPDRNRIGTKTSILSINRFTGQFLPDEFGDVQVGAVVPLKNFKAAVVVEEPIKSAYSEMRLLETNSLLFVIAGILLTVFTGIFLAQSIESPIKKLITGTEEISKGNLNYAIDVDSIDEMGRLAQAFNKMTHDLNESQERLILSEKLASLGTMAAGMAHEIKNPLVSLRTFSQLLQQKWDDPEFREKFSQIVPTEIERINKIAESLLKFGRPMKPEMAKVNINSILEEILVLFESECRKNGVRVTTKLAELPEITGDVQQLSQAFVNIILNGIQAMEKGGELIVKTDVGEVVHLGHSVKGVKLEDGGLIWGEEEQTKETPQAVKSVFVEITDTGPGIAPETLKSLFDPFFTTKAKGTGMGLPITLRIIEEHKGSIKVRSDEGKGTTFIITLPQKI